MVGVRPAMTARAMSGMTAMRLGGHFMIVIHMRCMLRLRFLMRTVIAVHGMVFALHLMMVVMMGFIIHYFFPPPQQPPWLSDSDF